MSAAASSAPAPAFIEKIASLPTARHYVHELHLGYATGSSNSYFDSAGTFTSQWKQAKEHLRHDPEGQLGVKVEQFGYYQDYNMESDIRGVIFWWQLGGARAESDSTTQCRQIGAPLEDLGFTPKEQVACCKFLLQPHNRGFLAGWG